MMNHFKKIFLGCIALFFAACSGNKDSTENTSQKNHQRIWYKQAKVDLGAKIQMIDENYGVAISRGKGSEVKGKVLIFQNSKWSSIEEYPYSDYPLIEQRSDGAVWFVHHGTHHDFYKPHFKTFLNNKIEEIQLPKVMWDETDWAMWLGISSSQNGKSFMVGQRGNIIYYDGKSWSEFESPVKSNSSDSYQKGDLHDVQMLSDTSGWAIGKNGVILKFTGGKWERINSNIQNELKSISMIDENNGWIVGEQGIILKYENGKWNRIDSGVRVNLNAVKAFDKNNAWICGARSTLLEYKEGIWMQDNSISTIDDVFTDLDVIKDKSGKFRLWIIGDNGIYTNSQNMNFSFTDITSKASLRKEGRAAMFFDYNKDELPEIFVLSEDGPNILYENVTGNLFNEVKKEKAGNETNNRFPLGIIGDINNDGFDDIIEIMDDINYSVKFGRSGFGFVARSKSKNLELNSIMTDGNIVSSSLVDFDNDGNLDIYIANHNMKDMLLRNNGAGQFTNVFDQSGIIKLINHRSYSATFSDLNNDGLTDIVLSYKVALNGQHLFLFINKGDFKFIEKKDRNFFTNTFPSTYSVIAKDMNNDGYHDLLVFNNEEKLQFLINKGDASFIDVADSVGFSKALFHPEPTNGIMNAADVNNDGWLDLYISSKLYINSPGFHFNEVSEQVGVGFIGSPSFADIDNDGDIDLYVGSSRGALGSGDRAVLYRNNSFDNNYVKFILDADESNRAAIGAKVFLHAYNEDGKKEYTSMHEYGLGSSAIIQQQSSPIHFGVNPKFSYNVEVVFPSGIKQKIQNIQINHIFRIAESSFITHHFLRFQKSIARSIILADWLVESIKFVLAVIVFSLLILYAGRSKAKKVAMSWYFICGYILLYAVLVHLNIEREYLAGALYTFVPIAAIGVAVLFTASKIIEERESKYISHYKLIEIIGVGGMGKVFKAVDTHSNKVVAVKVLNPHLLKDEENRKRLASEGRLLSSINHPNIVRVYESGESKEHSFIAMEYLSGGTLNDYIEKNHPINISCAISIAKQICSGLEEIHSNDIIHRDLKSPNIMFDEEKQIRIMDFGLSKSPLVTTMTSLGTVLGTLGYVAPEQVTNMQIDQRVDIFSLGVILYQLVTNKLPFNGENEISLIHSIFNTQPELPSIKNPEVPISLEKIIMKCLEKDQNNRYSNVKEIITELDLVAV